MSEPLNYIKLGAKRPDKTCHYLSERKLEINSEAMVISLEPNIELLPTTLSLTSHLTLKLQNCQISATINVDSIFIPIKVF